MSELELRLLALGRELEVPAAPDVAPAVRARLEVRSGRPFPWRRAAALALAVLIVGVGVAFAVPQARTAILNWFHLGGVSVERVEALPPAVERSQAGGLGRPMSRAHAERRLGLGFKLALPPLQRAPTVYVLDDSLATVIVHAYGRPILLSQFRSSQLEVLKKLAAGKTTIESVKVDGYPGLWLEGGPHTLTYLGRDLAFRQLTVRIHGNVLLWVRDGRTLRLEGKLTRAQALLLARRVR